MTFTGQLIRPWHRRTRRKTVRAALQRVATLPKADLHQTANSYFGLFRQASHSHTDRAHLANLLRKRGKAVAATLTKTYRSKGAINVA